MVETPASMALPMVKPSLIPMRKAKSRIGAVYSPLALYEGLVSALYVVRRG
jgi:hypothetical protein